MLKEFKIISNRELFPVVPVFNHTNKPSVPWKKEANRIGRDYELKGINQWIDYINNKGELKKGKVTGYALITGKDSGIMVLDLDRNHGDGTKDGIEAYKQLVKSLELSKEDEDKAFNTFTVKTPNGGLHLYFKYREGLKTSSLTELLVDVEGNPVLDDNNKKQNIPIGIDIRSDGGVIISPGSHRKIGDDIREYKVYKDISINTIPTRLLEELQTYINGTRTTTIDGKKGTIKPGTKVAANKPGRPPKNDFYTVTNEGSRDETLYKYICSLVGKGITNSGELEGMAAAYNTTYIKPSLEHEIVIQKVDSAIKYINETKEKLKKESIVGYKDPKKAFLKYMDDNLRALINSDDDSKFSYWNGIAWNCLNMEETELLYGDFCKYAQDEVEKFEPELPPKDFDKLENKIIGWDKSSKATECFNSIKRDRDYVIDMKKIPSKTYFLCTSNGFIVDFLKYETREAKKEDYILNTLKYKLVDKDKSIEFMEENIFPLLEYSLGSRDRLDFLNQFVSTKMMGRRVQGALFNYGAAASGKSFFKKLLIDLLGDRCYDLNYSYLTTKHQGNSDTSRDDKLVGLHDKLLFVSSEPDDTDVLLMGKFKLILSGDSNLNARATHGKEQQIDLSKLDGLIDLNGYPEFTGYDAAIERRLYGINWENSIPHDKRDPNYYDNHVKPNFDYVFSYYVYLAMDICKDDFRLDNIDVLMKDTKKIRAAADSLTSFLNECVDIVPGEHYTIDDLYVDYMNYIKDEELKYSLPGNTVDKPKAAKGFMKKRIEESLEFKDIKYDFIGRPVRKNAFIGLGKKVKFIPVDDVEPPKEFEQSNFMNESFKPSNTGDSPF